MNERDAEAEFRAWLEALPQSDAPRELRDRVLAIPATDRPSRLARARHALARRPAAAAPPRAAVALVAVAALAVGGALLAGGGLGNLVAVPSPPVAVPSGGPVSPEPSAPGRSPAPPTETWSLDFRGWPAPSPGKSFVLVVDAVRTRVDAIDPASGVSRPFATCARGCTRVWSPAGSPDGRFLAYGEGPDAAGGPLAVMVLDLGTGEEREVARCFACQRPPTIAWSPDGATIAFDSDAGISTVAADGGGLALAIPGGRSPSFAPDGGLMYVAGDVMTASADGSVRRSLGHQGAWWAGWSPDGSRYAYMIDPLARPGPGDPYEAQLWVGELGGGRPVEVQAVPGCCIGFSLAAAWSPDGTTLALGGSGSRLVAVSADGSGGSALGVPVADGAGPGWIRLPASAGDAPPSAGAGACPVGSASVLAGTAMPPVSAAPAPLPGLASGRGAFVTSAGDGRDLWAVDGSGRPPRRIAEVPLGDWTRLLDMSADGSLVLLDVGNQSPSGASAECEGIAVVRADGSGSTFVARVDGFFAAMGGAFSPDGRKVAAATASDLVGGPGDVVVVDLRSGSVVRQRGCDGPGGLPAGGKAVAWSSGGDLVAVACDPVTVYDPSGAAAPTAAASAVPQSAVDGIGWTGSRLLIARSPVISGAGGLRVEAFDPATGSATPGAALGDAKVEWVVGSPTAPAFSPDGKALLATGTPAGKPGRSITYVVDPAGGAPRQVVDNMVPMRVGWSADGRSVVYMDLFDRPELVREDLATGRRTTLGPLPADVVDGLWQIP